MTTQVDTAASVIRDYADANGITMTEEQCAELAQNMVWAIDTADKRLPHRDPVLATASTTTGYCKNVGIEITDDQANELAALVVAAPDQPGSDK